ncbi:MAG TPA: OmpA family protein [Desulfomonilaceae bacterium]|nr:OmpA family protein [Desulfomonilaceae bacterium]
MGFFFRAGYRHWAIACLTLILVCSASVVRGDDCKRVSNILVLFDASGFMKEKDRYQLLLKQMGFFVQAMPVTADGFFNVGLRHWGLKVGLGCDNTESILGIQPWDPERFLNSFPKSVSYGVSSLTAGLRASADEVAGLGKTVIVVIGGGSESCQAEPIQVAERMAQNNPDVEIHTFQIGNSQDGRYFLKGIAEKARGTYNWADEITTPAAWHAWMKKYLVVPCGPSAQSPGGASGGTSQTVGVVTFDAKSYSVRSKDPSADATNLASLEAVARALKANPSARVVLHGYADGKGKPESNLKISQKRAEAVGQYLMRTYRIPVSQISAVAHGASPSALQVPPGSQERFGRRVEFELVQ